MLGGRIIELVKANTREDVAEGVRAYEYLNEAANVGFIVSGCIDDVSLGWLERMAEYRTPTLDTWTSCIGIIDEVVEEYDKYKMYFMNVANDCALATLSIDFGKDVLAKEMGWKSVVVLQEDTAFAGSVYELIEQGLVPEANIAILDHIVYDINTVDFAPTFNKAVAAGRAGGVAPLDDRVREMENEDIVIEKDGEIWLRYACWKPGESEPRTGREYTHNIKFDIDPPYDRGAPSMVVIQWYSDGSTKVVHPPKYANGALEVPDWLK